MRGTSSELKDFEVVGTIGEGSFAKVYKVIRRSDGQTYAMKRCKIGLMKGKDRDNALNEVRILASVANPYVIAYKEAIYDESTEYLYVIMEYAAGGDLFQQVKAAQRSRTHIDEKQIWMWAYQMILGLKSLHDLKILHRDFKCANIFLDGKRNVKIGDLNVSKCTQANLARTQVGTPYYTSPEVWNHQMYNHKSDIWSLGCLLYELCALKLPFMAPDMSALFVKVSKGHYDRIPSRYSHELSHLIACCLMVNHAERYDCSALLAMSSMRKKIEEFNSEDATTGKSGSTSVNGGCDLYYLSGSSQPHSSVHNKKNSSSQTTQHSISSTNSTSNTNTSTKNLLERIHYPSGRGNLQDRLPKPSYDSNNKSSHHHSCASNTNVDSQQQQEKQSYVQFYENQQQQQQQPPLGFLRRARSNSGFVPQRVQSSHQQLQVQHVQQQQQQQYQQRSYLSGNSSNSRVDQMLEQEIQRRLSCLNIQQENTYASVKNLRKKSEDSYSSYTHREKLHYNQLERMKSEKMLFMEHRSRQPSAISRIVDQENNSVSFNGARGSSQLNGRSAIDLDHQIKENYRSYVDVDSRRRHVASTVAVKHTYLPARSPTPSSAGYYRQENKYAHKQLFSELTSGPSIRMYR